MNEHRISLLVLAAANLALGFYLLYLGIGGGVQTFLNGSGHGQVIPLLTLLIAIPGFFAIRTAIFTYQMRRNIVRANNIIYVALLLLYGPSFVLNLTSHRSDNDAILQLSITVFSLWAIYFINSKLRKSIARVGSSS